MDDFNIGDKLDFSQTDQPPHGDGSFVVMCVKCGELQAVCGKCLAAGVEPCPCSKDIQDKFSNYFG